MYILSDSQREQVLAQYKCNPESISAELLPQGLIIHYRSSIGKKHRMSVWVSVSGEGKLVFPVRTNPLIESR